MTIEKQSYLYEVLIRGARDGSVAGAHQIHNEVLIDTETGEVLSERIGVAADLAVGDVGALLGAAFMESATQIAGMQRRIDELTRERDQSMRGV